MLTPADRAGLDAAVAEARAGLTEGGVPIGAALIDQQGRVVATGRNLRVQQNDTTMHGETSCLRNAGRRRDWRTLTMVTTLSPCAMCAGAIILHKIPRVVIGERDTFLGREDWLRAEGVEIVCAQDDRCRELMRQFIERFPDVWAEDIGN